ncbi:MAG: NUMOD3 domain-containing DNA-binding protein [Candidatus Parcubacteria bacterium]|nr:NUMOD3 domain-containing DNA-binding protein [Candidatus Parcubacteria bacterium]
MTFGLIYRAVNRINGRAYIGQTIQGVEERIKEHKKDMIYYPDIKFYRALQKYGFDNFEWEVICDKIPYDMLNIYEIWFIDFYSSYICGYNSTIGGGGAPCSLETREKLSKKLKGRILTPEWREKISKTRKELGLSAGSKNYMFGKRGKEHPSFGVPCTEDRKKKISIANKGKLKGRISPNKGRNFSPESKAKMSEAQKRNPRDRDPITGRFTKI